MVRAGYKGWVVIRGYGWLSLVIGGYWWLRVMGGHEWLWVGYWWL